MLTPHEFKRTRAARPRPDLGGDDLADLGTTCWCVGRISTYKHLSIGKAHAVLPKNWFVLAASGRPVWAAVRGGVGVACRTGGRQYWPTPWPSAVVASVRVAGVLAGGPCRWRPSAVLAVGPWLVSVRGRGGRFRGRWRPFGRPLVHWPAVVLLWPVAARFWALPVVRRDGVRWPCVLALSVGSVPPPLVARRRWCAVLVLACLVCAVGGRGGRVAGRPCWCRWCRCHCAVPWPVVRVAGQPCRRVACVLVSLRRPVVGRVPWSVRRAGVRRGVGRWPCPSVLAGVLVCGRWLASVYCRVPWPWRPFRAVGGAGVRRWSLRPVRAVFWALPTGWPCGPCQWLAAVAGGACACGGACLVKERRPVAGWRWAVCGAFRGGGVRLPCWWSLLVSHQRRPWPPV